MWLYQKNMNTSAPVLTPDTVVEAEVVEPVEIQPVPEPVVDVVETDYVEESVDTSAPEVEPVFDEDEEQVMEAEEEIDTEPVIYDSVPAKFGTSGQMEDEERRLMTEEELLANKPAYGAGSKHDKMFISADDYRQQKAPSQQQVMYDDEDVFYDDIDSDEYYFD